MIVQESFLETDLSIAHPYKQSNREMMPASHRARSSPLSLSTRQTALLASLELQATPHAKSGDDLLSCAGFHLRTSEPTDPAHCWFTATQRRRYERHSPARRVVSKRRCAPAMASRLESRGQYRSTCPPAGVMSIERISGEEMIACTPATQRRRCEKNSEKNSRLQTHRSWCGHPSASCSWHPPQRSRCAVAFFT